MVEDRRLGRARGLPIVMAGDRVEELCQSGRVEISRPLLDHPQAEVDMAEQAAFLGLMEARPPPQLTCAAEVVKKRSRQQ